MLGINKYDCNIFFPPTHLRDPTYLVSMTDSLAPSILSLQIGHVHPRRWLTHSLRQAVKKRALWSNR